MKYHSKKSPARRIALGGMITVINLICLYLVSVLPTNRIFFFWASTLFIGAMLIEFDVPSALLTFLTTSILGFFIVPNKLVMIPFTIYFGYYGIVKYYVERLNFLLFEWIIKLILFNSALYIIYSLLSQLTVVAINIALPIWGIIALAQIAFIVYDYCYSLMVKYYKTKLRRYL